jgi:hypothetical protein
LHFENKGLQAFVEYKIQTSTGGEHVPDLFVIGNKHTFIKEKGSLPTRADIFQREIQQLFEYDVEHVHEGIQFRPQVILMCPQDIFLKQRSALSSYRRKLCVISYPFPTEDPIVFKREQGTIADEKLVKPLSGKENVPQSRTTVPKIKFLRENPPVPYTAWQIWLALWQFSSPMNINLDFGVEYSAVLQQCRLFYPPWLSEESVQITEGRLRDALKLLSYAG